MDETALSLTETDDRFAHLARLISGADGRPLSALIREVGLDPARDLKGCNFRGMDFRGSDLTGFDLTECDLRASLWDTDRAHEKTIFMGAMFGTNAAPMLPEDRQKFRDILHDPGAPWRQKFRVLGIYLETYGVTETAFRIFQIAQTITKSRDYRLAAALLISAMALEDRSAFRLCQELAGGETETLSADETDTLRSRAKALHRHLSMGRVPRRTPADVDAGKLAGVLGRVLG